MFAAITALISTGINAWSAHSKQKASLKSIEISAQHRLKQARIESQIRRAEQGDVSAISLDQLSFQHRGIKDDYLLIITTMPLLLLFTAPLFELVFLQSVYVAGDLTNAVMSGFNALQIAPDWYLVALALIYVDTFGFRRMLRSVIESRLGQWAGQSKKQ